jgi:putative nucleotidyltransferase with HDIG domain
MALEPSLEEQQLLADTLAREGSQMTRRELVAGALAGGGFIVAVGLLCWLRPPGAFAVPPVLVCALVMVLATRAPIDTPFGFTVPTQLAFVPLLFAMPAVLVPAAVMVTLALARLPEVIRGQVPSSRLLQAAPNSWFAVGPALVFALAGTEPGQAGALLLLAALAAQFLVDFTASSLLYMIVREADLASQLREAWAVYAIDAALSGVALIVAEHVRSKPIEMLALVPVMALFSIFARERHQRLESLLELNNAYRGTALVLGDVVEADDGYTGLHCKTVVGLALAVADELRLGAEQRRNLEFAALLHDVGKVVIPKEIINKPGKLNAEEWRIIKTHTIEGQKMLERVGGFMREVGLIVRSHHERWDGGGYPDGLAGEAIPLEARIVACCDTWNAMRTDRSYRQALAYEVALAELLENSASQFDPRVVKALVQVVAAEEGSEEILDVHASLLPEPQRQTHSVSLGV